MTLYWYVLNGIVRQINVCCDIHIAFDSRCTYSNNIECLICNFRTIFQVIKTFVETKCTKVGLSPSKKIVLFASFKAL